MANREQVLRFRLEGQHLANRLPPGGMVLAAGACGVQNTPPGSAALSLHARVAGLLPVAVDQALADKSLLQVWSLRGAPHVVPTGDAGIFTSGVLPGDEASLLFFVRGIEPALALAGMSLSEVVDHTSSAVRAVLDGRVLANKQKLDQELARNVLPWLTAEQARAWQSPSIYAAGQLLGEAMVSFALRVSALQGQVCFAPQPGNNAVFARTDQWLGAPLSPADPQVTRAELLRRYLRCYGPSAPGHFADWAGIAPAQAAATWNGIADELLPFDNQGQQAWLLGADRDRFNSPSAPAGVRFLPPHDPLLQMRDREVLAPDPALRRRIWRRAGSPGVVLVDGQLAGLWRARKQGGRLHVQVETLAQLTPALAAPIEEEAAGLAPFRLCTAVEVSFTPVA